MPKITDTYSLAYACCETILKELNRFPTIDLIRERIGVNSPNTIKKAMNDWTEAFAKQYIEQQQSKMLYPEVPVVLNDAVYQLWKRCVKEAGQQADAKTADLQAQIEGLQQTLDQQQAALSETQHALENATFKGEAAQTQIATLNHKINHTQNERLEAQQQAQTLATALEEQTRREIALKEQHSQRLQQEQDWMQRRILEERELAAEKWETKQKQLDERLSFLKSQADQAVQSQTLLQTQNQQLLTELAEVKAQQKKNTSAVEEANRFKRNKKGAKFKRLS